MIGAILAAGELILGAGSALLNHSAQNKNAAANDTAATNAFDETSRALALRKQEEALATAQQVHGLAQEAASRRGMLASNAASSGVAGNTVDALGSELMSSEYNARDIIDRNLVMTNQSIEQQRKSAIATMEARKAGVAGASDIGTALQIGGSLAAFGYDWMKIQPPNQVKRAP